MSASVECSECLVRDFTNSCALIRGIRYGGVSHAVLASSSGTVVAQTRQCLLLAQSGHYATEFQCPLLGVKRTSIGRCRMSAFDPKRTSLSSDLTTSSLPV